MFIKKISLPRRTFLRGMGTTLALPLLDAMVPAATVFARAVAPVQRFGVVYVPNGMIMQNWLPEKQGPGFAFTPTLKPLEPFKKNLAVLSGLDNVRVGTSAHAGKTTAFLTGVTPGGGADEFTGKTSEYSLRAGISVDQILARELGNQTQLASLELAIESRDAAGSCDVGYSCTYTNTISWLSETTPLPMEYNPRAVFEQLFGDSGSTDPRVRRERLIQKQSVLDSVRDSIMSLERDLGPHDQTRLSEYFDAVRDVERRIQIAEEQSSQELPALDQPPGVPTNYADHVRLMFDLQLLAYRADLTRVATFMMAREISGRTYPEIGVPDSHHPTTHHRNDPKLMEKVSKINLHHATLFAEYVEKLRQTPDGDGSMLDHTTLLYGAAMSDPNGHNPVNLPIVLLGENVGSSAGQHVAYPEGTPFTNLLVTLMERFGVPIEQLGSSTGKVELPASSL